MVESSREQTRVVSAEFPRDLLPLLRCSRDGGPLELAAELRSGAVGIIEGRLRCETCASEYRIEDGIACLLEGSLTSEDEHEIAMIDAGHACTWPDHYVPPADGWRSEYWDRMEIPFHLAELEPLDGCRVLEFGCGDGRFTILMAQMGARVLAVDFSLTALHKLAWWLQIGVAPTTYQTVHRCSTADVRAHIGLVRADASHFHVAPRSFERALSATPLDSRDERMRMYHTVADALTDQGRYVGGVEHDSLLRRLLGLPIARRYTSGGIFIEHFDMATLRCQAAPYFAKLRIRPIRPFIPLVRRLPVPWSVWVSRLIGALPVLTHLGQILLLRAEHPIRPPVEGAMRPGNQLVKGFLRLCCVIKVDKFF